MRNHEGTPIWYELLTNDPAAHAKFYEHVVGWKFGSPMPGNAKYRAFAFEGGMVGGMLHLDDDMRKGGAKPTWLVYFGVDDVDATAKKVEEHGGTLLMKPFDIPNAGRAAMATDPQGNPFYVMRGSTDAMSGVYDRNGVGKVSWNELYTPDQAAGNTFYQKVLGFEYPDKMAMGEMGDYIFVQAGEQTIGATMKQPPGAAPGWMFYFRVSDLDAAVERVKASDGKIVMGPQEVPGGERIIMGIDSQGVGFGLVAGKSTAK
jgi:predicted enzyme related to lactoylglutathione lyase